MADVISEPHLNTAMAAGESSDSFEDALEASTSEVNGASKSQGGNDITANGIGEPLLNVDEAAADSETPSREASEQTPRNTRPALLERSRSPSKRLSRPISISNERSRSPTKGKRLSMGLPIRPSSALSDFSTSIAERSADEQSEGPSSPPRHPDPPARKPSSGFAGLFGRMSSMSSIRRTGRSPPGSSSSDKTLKGRRSTAGSITSIDTSGLASIADDETPKTAKPSLQDQFNTLRQQEENGLVEESDEQKTPIVRKWSDASGTSTTASTANSDATRSRASSGLKSPSINPSLPPGTAAGVSVGPAVDAQPVNWDLWQTLVYEGPEIVAKTSGEDLNRAIASGIPAAIRGVVWQVLAESKNEGLESIYRTLKARGPELDPNMQTPPLSRAESQMSANDDINSSSPTDGTEAAASTTPPSRSGEITTSDGTAQAVSNEIRPKLLVERQKREAAAIAKLEKVIKRDMGTRTSFSKYVQSAGLQSGLFGVCKAYALFDEGVGYAQGINFITMPLLFNMSEEEAFTLLVRLMSKYDVRSLFTAEMPGLHLRLYQFERLLEDFEPALYCHLRRRNVHPQLYATQWFLTLFAYRFPLQLVLRIYDLIFGSGLSAILQIGIVLMQKNRDVLLEMKDMGQLTTFLKEKLFDVYIDKSPSASSILDSGFFGAVTGGIDKEVYRADDLVRDACGVKISDVTLMTYSAEWEETQRTERERTEELERLRVTNLSMTSRVRALEEQVQQQDVEHVAIAGDLVRVKVANDELHDENEGLKMKVTELQRMVDLQPGEVEGRLKEEMDRIMQRNIEVQNENRAMREEMDDVESELVKAKMSYAEIQAEHDALKQKWSSVQAMLNAT